MKTPPNLDPEKYAKAVDAVSYYLGGAGYQPGSFAMALVSCLLKADGDNFEKLRTVFPEYAKAVEESKRGK